MSDFHRNIVPSLVDIETREQVMDYFANNSPNDSVCVELGVFTGGTVFRLADGLEQRKIKSTIYAVDDFKYSNISPDSFRWAGVANVGEGKDKFFNWIKEFDYKYVSIIPIELNSVEASNQFADKSIDYIFMDASHGYGGVCEELKAWLPKMKDKCFIAIHDYCDQGIKAAVLDTCGSVVRSNDSTGIIRDDYATNN